MNREQTSGLAKLAGVLLAMGVIWLGMLPVISQSSPVRRRVEQNYERGIDPSALYYTELEGVTFLDEL